MFGKLYLEAVSWVKSVSLSSHELSPISKCDRVSSPVLFQQLSNQPLRLLLSVLADSHSSRRREVIRDFLSPISWTRTVSHPLLSTPQFREDAGGFEILFWFVHCYYRSILFWPSLNVHEKDVIPIITQGSQNCYFCYNKKCRMKPHIYLFNLGNVVIRWPDFMYFMVTAQCCHWWQLRHHDNNKHFLNMTQKQGVTYGCHGPIIPCLDFKTLCKMKMKLY